MLLVSRSNFKRLQVVEIQLKDQAQKWLDSQQLKQHANQLWPPTRTLEKILLDLSILRLITQPKSTQQWSKSHQLELHRMAKCLWQHLRVKSNMLQPGLNCWELPNQKICLKTISMASISSPKTPLTNNQANFRMTNILKAQRLKHWAVKETCGDL